MYFRFHRARSASLTLFLRLAPESVRWLLTQGRTREAERLIRKMAETNGATISPHLLANYDTAADGEEEPPLLPTREDCDTEVRGHDQNDDQNDSFVFMR